MLSKPFTSPMARPRQARSSSVKQGYLAASCKTPTRSTLELTNDLHPLLLRRRVGTPLLLLHGWPEWSHVWRPVMSRLVGRFDLIAPDFRGFGDTQKTALQPSKDATPDALASDILALADRLGSERFGLVAHDVGGFVA
jgi:pimeloyl-ACP methyl ester carboxylesterase